MPDGPIGGPPDAGPGDRFDPFLAGRRVAAGRLAIPMNRLVLPPGTYPDPPTEGGILTLIVRGNCGLEADLGDGRTRREVGPGLVALAPARAACEYVLDGEVEALALHLPGGLVAGLGDLGPCAEGFRDPLVEAICLRLWDEAGDGHPGGPLLVDSAAQTLAAALLGRSGRAAAGPSRRNRLDGAPLRRVLDYMEAHLDGPVRLADLAAVAHLSEFHFARLFRRATGLAPHQHLIRLRVDRARRLIRERRLSLAQVAAACGFSDQGQLARHFKRIVGVSPGKFG